MFGGTKGKFNGLGLLSDIQDGDRNRGGGQRQGRNRGFDERDYYYDVNDDEMEEEYEEFDEEYYYNDNRRNRNKKRNKYDYDDEYEEIDFEDDEYDYDNEYRRNNDYGTDVVVSGRKNSNGRVEDNIVDKRQSGSNSLLPPSQMRIPSSIDDDVNDKYNNEKYDDDIENDSYTSSYREQRSQQVYIKTQRQSKGENRNGADRRKQMGRRMRNMGDNDEPGRRRRIGRQSSIASTWFEDEESEDDKAWIEKRRGGNRDDGEKASPIINLLDAVFQVDSEEVKYQAG